MKKLLITLFMCTICIGSIPAETRSSNPLVGWWAILGNQKAYTMNSQGEMSPIIKRKMFFSEDNNFFSAYFTDKAVTRSNGGQYRLFNDGTVATYHEDNFGKPFGLVNTYHVTIKGDSMHFYGFYINAPSIMIGGTTKMTTLQSSVIDEWWVRDASNATDKTDNEKAASIKWVKKQASKSPGKKFLAIRPNFLRDSAICYGYISGFNEFYNRPRTAYYYYSNVPSTAFIIQPDGRFVFTVPASTTNKLMMTLDNLIINLYVEPGKALGLVFDYKDLFNGKNKNRSELFQFFGPLAAKNKTL